MTSVQQLNTQMTTVKRGIANSKNSISNLDDKISRLMVASTQMTSSISQLESIKSTMDRLTVDKGSWKGKEQEAFDEEYSSFQDSTKDYLSKAENAKEAIDQDIKRYEASKAMYETGLLNLENSLISLEWQVSQAEKG